MDHTNSKNVISQHTKKAKSFRVDPSNSELLQDNYNVCKVIDTRTLISQHRNTTKQNKILLVWFLFFSEQNTKNKSNLSHYTNNLQLNTHYFHIKRTIFFMLLFNILY